MKYFKGIILTVLLLSSCFCGMAALSLPKIFADNMVLQRGNEVLIWGRSAPGKKVFIAFRDQHKVAVANPDSSWAIKLDRLKAGGPYNMQVSNSAGEKITIHNILIGEVWICAGQSNMNFVLSDDNNGPQEIKNLDNTNIREFRCRMPEGVINPENKEHSKWITAVGGKANLFSAVAYYYAKNIQASLHVPVGIIVMSCGATRAESWTNPDVLQLYPQLKPLLHYWDLNKNDKDNPVNFLPGKFYTDVVKPVAPYAAKGLIWYQGESNTLPDNSGRSIAARAAEYKPLLQAVIKSWRTAWKNDDWPVYIVQLPNYKDSSGNIFWAEIRQAQLEVSQKTHNTALAITIDAGDSTNIHPKDKKTVGERIARLTLHKEYGQRGTGDANGPIVKSMRTAGNKAVLEFSNVKSGLQNKSKGDKLLGFEMADVSAKDRFVKANATIDHDKVIISSADIKHPEAVRYGWADNPVISLFNGTGLPASPFLIRGHD